MFEHRNILRQIEPVLKRRQRGGGTALGHWETVDPKMRVNEVEFIRARPEDLFDG